MKILVTTDWHYGFSEKANEKIISMLGEISKKDFDIFVHCGDVGSHNPNFIKDAIGFLCENVKDDIPKLFVLGNHDFWSVGRIPHQEIIDAHDFIFNGFKKRNVHYLHEHEYEDDKIRVFGCDGWYGSSNPDTNDYQHMTMEFGYPGGLHSFYRYSRLVKWFAENAGKMLFIDSKKINIFVTHFGLFKEDPNFKPNLSGDVNFANYIKIKNFDFVFYGHSHKPADFMINNIHVINVGSDYENPKYMIVEK